MNASLRITLCFVVFIAIAKGVLGHMSMQFPVPRDKKNGSPYLVWQQNIPMIPGEPQVCHGLDKDASVRSANIFRAGDTLNINIYGGAPHGGGHCAFWYTTQANELNNWKKLVDIKDCTTVSPVRVQLPANMDVECATRCTFAWSWQPMLSGSCEIYMNCADIQVQGVTGGFNGNQGVQINFQQMLTTPCVRVNDATHFGTMFGSLTLSQTSSGTTSVSSSTGGSSMSSSSSSSTGNVVDGSTIQVQEAGMCLNPNAPKGNLAVSNSTTKCGKDYPNIRCDDGQCCSKYGYCGPIPARYDYTNNVFKAIYEECTSPTSCTPITYNDALNLYCNSENQGDWRLVPCTSSASSVFSYSLMIVAVFALIFALVMENHL